MILSLPQGTSNPINWVMHQLTAVEGSDLQAEQPPRQQFLQLSSLPLMRNSTLMLPQWSDTSTTLFLGLGPPRFVSFFWAWFISRGSCDFVPKNEWLAEAFKYTSPTNVMLITLKDLSTADIRSTLFSVHKPPKTLAYKKHNATI